MCMWCDMTSNWSCRRIYGASSFSPFKDFREMRSDRLAQWHYRRVRVIKICGNEMSFASSVRRVVFSTYLLLSDWCDHRWSTCSIMSNSDTDWRHQAKCVKACPWMPIGTYCFLKKQLWSMCVWMCETPRQKRWHLHRHLGCTYLRTPSCCTSSLHCAERCTTDVTTACTVGPAWRAALSPPPLPLRCTEECDRLAGMRCEVTAALAAEESFLRGPHNSEEDGGHRASRSPEFASLPVG